MKIPNIGVGIAINDRLKEQQNECKSQRFIQNLKIKLL